MLLFSRDLDIPSTSQRGILTTIEGTAQFILGVISRVIEGLEQLQPQRKDADLETYNKIEAVIATLNSYLTGSPFTFVLDDPGRFYFD